MPATLRLVNPYHTSHLSLFRSSLLLSTVSSRLTFHLLLHRFKSVNPVRLAVSRDTKQEGGENTNTRKNNAS